MQRHEDFISADALRSIVNALHAASLHRLVLTEGLDGARIIDQHLQLNVLRTYEAELAKLDASSAFSWLIGRMASIEASITALQTILVRHDASPVDSAAPVPRDDALSDFFSPEVILVEFDDTLVCTGFYPAEGKETGLCYRWLGPRSIATVHVPKISGKLRLTIRVQKAADAVPLSETRVSVDRGGWTPCDLISDIRGLVLRSEITPGPKSTGSTTRIDIDCIATSSPSTSGGTDLRRLGIAISVIEISKAI